MCYLFLKKHFIFFRVQNHTCLEVDASCNNEVFAMKYTSKFFSHCVLFFSSDSLNIRVD